MSRPAYHPADRDAYGLPAGLRVPLPDVCCLPSFGTFCGAQSVTEIAYDGTPAGLCGPCYGDVLAAIEAQGLGDPGGFPSFARGHA
jgi:hypothetical protein